MQLLYFGQMGDCAFGMLGSHICVTSLAMSNGFLEMLDPFVQVRIFHTGRLGMFEGPLSMLHQGIGMALLAMSHSFLGMLDRFAHMLVVSKGKPAEQRETNKRRNRRYNQCSTMDSHFHGLLLNG
jgi:hypothetical protein